MPLLAKSFRIRSNKTAVYGGKNVGSLPCAANTSNNFILCQMFGLPLE